MSAEDGYIKYKCIHTNKELGFMPIMNDINMIRAKLFELGLIGIYPSKISYGNISCKISNSTFIISGTQTGELNQLEPKHFAIVEKADIENNTLYSYGQINASSESMSHSAIYRANYSINCVIHVHCFKLWAKLLNQVPTTPQNAEFGTPEIANAINSIFNTVPDITHKGIIALGGHQDGLIAYGKDLNSAYETIIQYY